MHFENGKTFTATTVFHTSKQENLKDFPHNLRVNPTLSLDGMKEIYNLLPAISELGPFNAVYCSRVARALDTASVIALELDLEIITCKTLGQHASKDSGEVVFLAGHEGEWFSKWQNDAIESLQNVIIPQTEDGGKILIVSHRPIIAGLIGVAKGISDDNGLENLILPGSPYVEKGLVTFEITADNSERGFTIKIV